MKGLYLYSIGTVTCLALVGCTTSNDPADPISSASSQSSQQSNCITVDISTDVENQACVYPNGTIYASGSTSSQIAVIDSPKPSQTISSPVQVKGEVVGTWMFEGSTSFSIVDSTGEEIERTVLQAQSDWMTESLVPVLGTGSVKLSEGTYYFILHKENASGNPEMDAQAIFPFMIGPGEVSLSDQEKASVQAYVQDSLATIVPFAPHNNGVFTVGTIEWLENGQFIVQFEDGHYEYSVLLKAEQADEPRVNFIQSIVGPDTEYAGRSVIYTVEAPSATEQAVFAADCRTRGGELNECGSICPPDAEACVEVCALTCEFQEVNQNWDTSTFDEVGITIEHPADFIVQDMTASPADAMVRLQFTGPTQSRNTELYDGISVNISRYERGTETASEYLEDQLAQARDLGEVIESPEEATIADLRATRYVVRTLGEFTHYLWEYEGGFIDLSYTAPDPTNAGYAAVVERMINSIEME